MVSVTSEVSASVPVPPAPSKSSRAQDPQPSDQFGALVDSNTAAANNAQSNSQPDPAPRRSDNAPPPSSDKGPRDSSAADSSSQTKANDAADDAPPASNDASSDPAKTIDKAPDKTKGKTDTSDSKSASKSDSKGDSTGTDTTGTADGLSAAIDASQQGAAQPATPDPNAVAVPIVVAPADAGTAGGQPAGAADSPLTIAAAGLAASASTAAQIVSATQGKTGATAGSTDKTDKTATGDAAATTTAQDATGQTGAKPTDPQASGALASSVEATTPKTSFKQAATAQSKTDVSDIGGQDAAKTGTANGTLTPTQATAANAAAHPQAAKAEIDAATGDIKANAADRGASTPQPAATHEHSAAAQVQASVTDTSAQAASALQAPATTTTSVASASTATLTATAANATAVPLSGVPIEIAANVRSGKTRFDISLDPAELGRIDVRISVDRNGQVTSHLTVEKPETLSMLRQDAPQLQRALDDAGLKTGDGGLSFSLRDQSSSGQNGGNANDNRGQSQRLIISDEDALPQPAAGRSYGRMLGSSSGVDIRV